MCVCEGAVFVLELMLRSMVRGNVCGFKSMGRYSLVERPAAGREAGHVAMATEGRCARRPWEWGSLSLCARASSALAQRPQGIRCGHPRAGAGRDWAARDLLAKRASNSLSSSASTAGEESGVDPPNTIDTGVFRGRVVSHRANFVHVQLQKEAGPGGHGGDGSGEGAAEGMQGVSEAGAMAGEEEGEGEENAARAREGVELLCVTRQVLKKLKRSVLVGDFVEVTSVDWTLGHGVVSSVLPRESIFQTPAVANVQVRAIPTPPPHIPSW